MNIFLIALVALFLPVSLTIMLICQTIGDRRRRKQGLPPKKHHNIKDFNIIEVFMHNADE